MGKLVRVITEGSNDIIAEFDSEVNARKYLKESAVAYDHYYGVYLSCEGWEDHGDGWKRRSET